GHRAERLAQVLLDVRHRLGREQAEDRGVPPEEQRGAVTQPLALHRPPIDQRAVAAAQVDGEVPLGRLLDPGVPGRDAAVVPRRGRRGRPPAAPPPPAPPPPPCSPRPPARSRPPPPGAAAGPSGGGRPRPRSRRAAGRAGPTPPMVRGPPPRSRSSSIPRIQ